MPTPDDKIKFQINAEDAAFKDNEDAMESMRSLILNVSKNKKVAITPVIAYYDTERGEVVYPGRISFKEVLFLFAEAHKLDPLRLVYSIDNTFKVAKQIKSWDALEERLRGLSVKDSLKAMNDLAITAVRLEMQTIQQQTYEDFIKGLDDGKEETKG